MNNKSIKTKKKYEKPEILNQFINKKDELNERSVYNCTGGWGCT